MPRVSPYTVNLSPDEAHHLAALARRYTAPYGEVIRAKIVLLAAQGLSNDQIATRVDLPRQIVSKWRQRFFFHRLSGLQDHPRHPRAPSHPPRPIKSGECN